MNSTITTAESTTRPLDATTDPTAAPAPRRRLWAWSGVGAGLAGIVSIGASMQVDAVYAPGVEGDPAAIVARLADETSAILAFHTATLVSMALLVVFAAGLRRRLAGQLPSRSLLPDVAGGGPRPGRRRRSSWAPGSRPSSSSGSATPTPCVVPEAAVFFGHWVGTIPWLWVGAGLAGVAVAVAALRHGATAALGRLGRGRPRRRHPRPRALAAAVHGRHDRADLAAAHGDRPRARRPGPRA